MKARPRSVENQVADFLNTHFERLGMSAVERIPVLGRTGPDISINEMRMVVDVKSRLSIPQSIFFPIVGPFRFDTMTGCRLCCLPDLWDVEGWTERRAATVDFQSKTLRDFLDHMELWTAAHEKTGVSCIIAHRPKMPIGDAVAIIYSSRRRQLIEHARNHYNQRNCDHPLSGE